jgi:hypothetical protein
MFLLPSSLSENSVSDKEYSVNYQDEKI